jgi:hypothetical protein
MRIKTKGGFRAYCSNTHDIECNQKYGNTKPYSYHLGMVVDNVTRFKSILPSEDDYTIAYCGAWGHDLIEDARITYNDIVQQVKIKGTDGKPLNVDIAEVIYSCTEEKGKNRGERLSEKFYSDLRENKVGVFVKLCDVLANVTEGKNTGSGMFKKYQKEYPKLKRNLYLKEYDKLFVELETLLEIDN